MALSISPCSYSTQGKKKNKTHREHSAHVHGGANLAIAFDENKGKIEFRGAAKSILGFEHQPKTEQEKSTITTAVISFGSEMDKMIQFDPALGCVFTKDSVGQIEEKNEKGTGEHSDWSAVVSITCNKNPIGTKVKIDFSMFKKLNDIDISILIGDLQKSAEYKTKPLDIELK